MTSEAREASWDQGQPVQFFRFTRGSVHWYYTSSEYFETLLEETYTPAAIARSSIRQGSERAKNSIKVTLPSTLPVADNFRPFPSNQTIVLTIFVRHVGESDALAEWVGRVTTPSFDGAVLTLTCEPSQTRSRKGGTATLWQRPCGKVLYGKGHAQCNLDPDAVTVPGTLTSVTGAVIVAAGFAQSPRSLVGGHAEWVDGAGATQQRTITGHTGQSVTLASAMAGMAAGAVVTAYTKPLTKDATLTAISGLTLTAAAFGEFTSGRLAGGFIQWAREDGLVEFRTIRTHSGTSVVIDYGAADLAPGLVVTAFPGCAHTWDDCGNHENQSNFGGDLWMPVKNPFNGNPVW